MDERLCEEKHRSVDSRVSACERRLNAHGNEIDALQKSDAANTTQIKNLTSAIADQTRAIWGLVGTVLITLFGFFIWYVQSK